MQLQEIALDVLFYFRRYIGFTKNQKLIRFDIGVKLFYDSPAVIYLLFFCLHPASPVLSLFIDQLWEITADTHMIEEDHKGLFITALHLFF